MTDAVESRLRAIEAAQPRCAPYAARDAGLRRLVLHDVPWLVAQLRILRDEAARQDRARLEGGTLVDALIDLFDAVATRRDEGYALPPAAVAALERIDALTAEPPRWWRTDRG